MREFLDREPTDEECSCFTVGVTGSCLCDGDIGTAPRDNTAFGEVEEDVAAESLGV